MASSFDPNAYMPLQSQSVLLLSCPMGMLSLSDTERVQIFQERIGANSRHPRHHVIWRRSSKDWSTWKKFCREGKSNGVSIDQASIILYAKLISVQCGIVMYAVRSPAPNALYSNSRRPTVQTVQKRLCTAPNHENFVSNRTAEVSHRIVSRNRDVPIVCMMFSQFHAIACWTSVWREF